VWDELAAFFRGLHEEAEIVTKEVVR
jgi:hypothetical protein